MVNARMDIATDVTLSRDLSQCDQFYSRELASSPLALLQKLVRHYQLHLQPAFIVWLRLWLYCI